MADARHNLESESSPAPPLIVAGWERRFLADPVQVREATALYESLGFEVHTEPLQPTELGPQCEACQLAVCHTYMTIYTRKA